MDDQEFVRELREKRGVDLETRTFNSEAEFGGIDQSFI